MFNLLARRAGVFFGRAIARESTMLKLPEERRE